MGDKEHRKTNLVKQREFSYVRSIRFRLVIFTVFMVLILLVTAVGTRIVYDRTGRTLTSSQSVERQKSFEEIREHESELTQVLSEDYSYWDDTVSFINSKLPSYPSDSLEPALDTFKTNTIWVYGLDGSVRNTTTDTDALPELNLTKDQLTRLFSASHFAHFYVNTSVGLYEIYGATVHPSLDLGRKTPPQGYFLAGKLYDQDYLTTLTNDTFGKASLQLNDVQHPNPPHYSKSSKTIEFSQPLAGINGETVALVVFSFKATGLSEMLNALNTLSVITPAVYLLAILPLLILISLTILGPLASIYSSIHNRSIKPVSKLLSKRNEFGQIAKALETTIAQQTILEREVKTREKTQHEQEKNAEELERLNQFMVGREIRMTELKKRIQDLESKKDSK